MSRLSVSLLYTRDATLARRLTGLLSQTTTLRTLETPAKLEAALERHRSAIVLADLRADRSVELIHDLTREHPERVVIALGTPGSDPSIECQSIGLYAVEQLDADRQRITSLVARALDHHKLHQENRALREDASRASSTAAACPPPAEDLAPPPARHFPGALRHFNNPDALLENLAEGVAGSLMVPRVGIFCRGRDSDLFRLRAGLRCLEDTAEIELPEEDPLPRWLTLNAHMVYRHHLEHIRNAASRLMLTQALDQLGAEVIVPLQTHKRLLGWMFVGHRSTGLPFERTHLENLMIVAEHVSTTLENALLYEQVAVQKTLAETLLHSMPTGIVAVGEDGVVRWFNNAAQQILDAGTAQVLNQRAEVLGSRLADILRRALRGDIPEQPAEWMDGKTRRTLSVQARRLMNGTHCLGAVALVQDLTLERMLEEKEEQLERTTFWTELASAMSHEVRNPLVAIKTFAQLLPERYEDDEFRNQFSEIVTGEVDRLNGIIDQINCFAHPPKLQLKSFDIRQAIRKGIDLALKAQNQSGVWIDTAIDDDLPPVIGDHQALAECFAHVINNAIEALAKSSNPRIVLSARRHVEKDEPAGVAVTFRDNGRGMTPDILAKAFSPFCTTKARGMGLGLPIVKRTIVDHNGRIHIDSTENGTNVTIVLPCEKAKNLNETYSDRRR